MKEKKEKKKEPNLKFTAEKGISGGYQESEPEEENDTQEEKKAGQEKTEDEEVKELSASNEAKAIAAFELQRKAPFLIRQSLINFVIEQELRLRYYDKTKGVDGWLDSHPLMLVAKLMEEVGEVADAILSGRSAGNIKMESVDVGNLAMMLAHKCGRL